MRVPSSRPVGRLTTALALAGTLGLSGGAAVMAQDATPVGTPIGPDECIAPTTTAAVLATPIVDETAAGAIVQDEAVIAEARDAIQNIYTCFNEGHGEAFVALFTEEGRRAAFGDVDPVDLAAEIEAKSTMVQAGEVEVIDVFDFGDGRLGVEYQVMVGKQVLRFVDELVYQNEAWLVDNREMVSPETDLDTATAGVSTSVSDGEVIIEVSPSPIMNQPALRLQLNNGGDSVQRFVLLQGGDAASITELDLTNLPEGVTFVGEALVEPGEPTDTLFEELEEGNYVIVVETAEGNLGTFDLTIDPPFDPNA